MVSFFGTDTSPSSGDSSPTIILKRVVFPAPFGPTRPTLSPGFSWNEASTNRIWRPYCLLTRVKDIIVRATPDIRRRPRRHRPGECGRLEPAWPIRSRATTRAGDADRLETPPV